MLEYWIRRHQIKRLDYTYTTKISTALYSIYAENTTARIAVEPLGALIGDPLVPSIGVRRLRS
jgi:hypothetical protein